MLDMDHQPAAPRVFQVKVYGAGLRRFRGRAGAAVVSDALLACDADGVRVVDVSAHPLGDGGLAQLVQALPRLRALHTLEVRDDDVGPAGVASLAAALRSPACFRSLTRLHLGANPLSDSGMHALACALGGLPASSSSSAMPREGGGCGDVAGGGYRSTVDGISVTLLCGARSTYQSL